MRGRSDTQPQLLHIYQRTVNGFVLFYTVSDFLVFFSIVSRFARKHNIRVIAIIPMFDHVHLLVECSDRKQVAAFVQEYSWMYAREFNISLNAKGKVFKKAFGCAVKIGMKKIRTACSYAYNNPGEKRLCKRAEQYRWTFLAYAVSSHPFSENIVLKNASASLRRAVKLVNCYHRKYDCLSYAFLERLFRDLSDKERRQLVDYIISLYNIIDYDRLISFYGDYESMLLAFASNQGSEYDIHEEFSDSSHLAYPEMGAYLQHRFGLENIKDVFRLDLDKRTELFQELLTKTSATTRQVEKYLRFKHASDNEEPDGESFSA